MSLEIFGPQASTYKIAIQTLDQGQTPEGWSTVASSINAQVSYSASKAAYLKIFLARNKLESLKAILRGSRCYRARKNGEFLSSSGFNTPSCSCWGKLSNGREFMITQASAGTGVTQYLREQLNTDKSPQGLKHKRLFLCELGTVVGQLHLAGIVHGDLRTSNVLTEFDGERYTVYFIDNERNSHHRTIPLALIKKNLVQLNMLLPTELSKTDRWKFFLAYSAAYPRFTTAEIKQLATEIYLTAMNRLRKKGKL